MAAYCCRLNTISQLLVVPTVASVFLSRSALLLQQPLAKLIMLQQGWVGSNCAVCRACVEAC